LGGVPEWGEELEVSADEMRDAVRKMKTNKAPGPDGIPGRVWALTMGEVGGPLRYLFTRCLREGVFPSLWKEARMVLLPKGRRDPAEPSAYLPLCLLDEVGKLMERIVVGRLNEHLSGSGGLNARQFEFRAGRSTIDAVDNLRACSERMTHGGVALAVSLDIVNAFNTLPWDKVDAGLWARGVPGYLVRMVRAYFVGRGIVFRDAGGGLRRREILRGVPQGSVLGPLLWNLAYDEVLGRVLLPGCHVICYADDTLVVAGGRNWEDAIVRGNIAVVGVVGGIKGLSLWPLGKQKLSSFMMAPEGLPLDYP